MYIPEENIIISDNSHPRESCIWHLSASSRQSNRWNPPFHLRWRPPSQYYHASVISHLNHHTCLGIPERPGLWGLWQNGHLSVFIEVMPIKRHICAAHMETLSFQCNLLHLQLPSLPLASVKVHARGWVTASALCTPLMTNAVFLGQVCHDSFLPQGKCFPSSLLHPLYKQTSAKLSCWLSQDARGLALGHPRDFSSPERRQHPRPAP